MTFGQSLRAAREARGWSRFRLSLAMKERFKHEKISESAIWLLETGGTKAPRGTTYSMLKEIFPELTGVPAKRGDIDAQVIQRFQKPAVYFIQPGALPVVKIGVTTVKIELRLNHLQVSSWEPLRLIGLIENGAADLEKEIHEKFSSKRIRGEWFRLDEDLARYIRVWARQS